MEKNCDITGEMDDHLPIKWPKEDHSFSESQSSSKVPVAAKWVDLFVKEITCASDSDDARIRAAKALKSFEAAQRAFFIPRVTEYLLERGKRVGSYEGPLYQESLDFIWQNEDDMSYFVTSDGKINPMATGMIYSDSEDKDEDAKASKEENLMRRKWGIDENGRMPENMQRSRKNFVLEPLVFYPIDKQPMDMFDDSDSEDEDEDEEAKAKEEEMLMRRKWGIDENGRMPENMQRLRKKFGLEPLVFGPIDKQPMDT